jgi:anti-sigma factor RsiW
MRCAQAQSLLSGYLDEELAVREMRRLAAHLEECRSCEAELRALQQAKAFLGGLEAPRARSGFWSEAYEQLQRENVRPMPWWRKLSVAQRSAMALIPAVVTAALAFQLAFQPPATNSGAVDSMDDLIQAHLEAKSCQPLTDQSHIRMLLSAEEVDNGISE